MARRCGERAIGYEVYEMVREESRQGKMGIHI